MRYVRRFYRGEIAAERGLVMFGGYGHRNALPLDVNSAALLAAQNIWRGGSARRAFESYLAGVPLPLLRELSTLTIYSDNIENALCRLYIDQLPDEIRNALP
jgi:hypothetical protein